MKAIIAILTAIIYCLLCSCYTKNQAIEKFCRQDTISTFVTLHDTIRTQTIQKDTLLSWANTPDTVIIQRDKMVIKYFKKDSIVYLQGTCQGDTFYVNKKVFVKIPALVPEPPAPSFKEKVVTWLTNGLALIGIVVLVILGFRYIISKLSK